MKIVKLFMALAVCALFSCSDQEDEKEISLATRFEKVLPEEGPVVELRPGESYDFTTLIPSFVWYVMISYGDSFPNNNGIITKTITEEPYVDSNGTILSQYTKFEWLTVTHPTPTDFHVEASKDVDSKAKVIMLRLEGGENIDVINANIFFKLIQ